MTDEQAMARALELAQRGTGLASPNPLVGCVILRDGRVIGEGWYHRFGAVHAEVDAVRNAGGDVQGATVVVSLEPCSYYGKTPPCADFLVAHKVGRVVAGTVDPNPRIAGRGIARLREAGIEVTTGVLEEECRRLNRAFFRYITAGVPYVVLKAAQSLDGCIATAGGQSFWITGEESRKRVHRMRAELDAVLVGANTVRRDDPELTVRLTEGRNPKRIVLAPRLRLSPDSKLFRAPLVAETFVVCSPETADTDAARLLRERGVTILPVAAGGDGMPDIDAVLRELGSHSIASVLVEGGAVVHSALMRADAVDELRLFYAPIVIGDGLHTFDRVSTEALEHARRFRIEAVEQVGADVLVTLVR